MYFLSRIHFLLRIPTLYFVLGTLYNELYEVPSTMYHDLLIAEFYTNSNPYFVLRTWYIVQ